MTVSDPATVGEMFGELREAFAAAGIENPAVDAELILAHVLGVSRGRVQALAILGDEMSDEDRATARRIAAEREDRIPLQHLIGVAPFHGIELSVGPGVFVPRPETEVTAQIAIDALAAVPDPSPIAVDLCTGSGAIALAIAAQLPTARVWAIEKSPEAHAWAERNVAALGDGRVELVLGDISDAGTLLPDELRGRAHVVVSNPPYVPDAMVPRDPEVREHDPAEALYGGPDGLDIVRILSEIASALLAPGGSLIIEHGERQGAAIRSLLSEAGWRAAATHRDLTLRDRVTTALR